MLVKSGSLRIESLTRSALKLKENLKKIIGEAYNQTQKVTDYIVSKSDLIFGS